MFDPYIKIGDHFDPYQLKFPYTEIKKTHYEILRCKIFNVTIHGERDDGWANFICIDR